LMQDQHRVWAGDLSPDRRLSHCFLYDIPLGFVLPNGKKCKQKV
jgi:hypothetical protein